MSTQSTSTSKVNRASLRGSFVLILLAIVLIAGWVRTYNIDWDEGTHLHPDERYLTMVVSALQFPERPSQYWNVDESPLNPANKGYVGYVYGTLPLFATRAVAEWMDKACVTPPNPFGTLLRAVLLNASGPCYPGQYTGYGNIHFVGRALSAWADLATLVALAMLARALYGNKVALFAAALYAFAVLPIQHAHFFVVDSFATVFVAWTLCFTVYAVRYRRPWLLLPAGFATGLAVASKISVWPLAGIVGLAALLHCEPPNEGKLRCRFAFRLAPIVAVVLSGVLAAFAFRIAQPYAFAGPGFFGVRINPGWMNTMKDAQDMASGLRDAPFGHQWTAREPIIFPLRNMVFWGMGLPLGIAAWIGWGAMAWSLLRKREWQHLLLWVWGTIFFLYQATLWVKSMRYLLPVYPVFTIFGAWVLMRGAQWAWHWTRPMLFWRKIARGVLLVLPGIVLAGTLLWGLAFLQIYTRSLTRVEASRWMFDNIPTAATVHTVNGNTIQITVHPNTILSAHTPTSIIPFVPEHESVVTHIALNDISATAVGGDRRVRIALTADPYGETVLAETATEFTLQAHEQHVVTVALLDPAVLKSGQQVYLDVTLLEGETLQLQTSIIATIYTMEGITIQIPVQPNTILSDYTPTSITPFISEYDVAINRITLNKVSAPEKVGNRRLRLALMTDPYGAEMLAQTTVDFSILASGKHVVEASLPTPVNVEAGQTVYLEVTLLEGDAIRLQTSVIGNEHWDDALPQRIDGKDAYGNWYRGLSSPSSKPDGLMHIYDNDTLEKRTALFEWLDEADYIVLSSNRAYASIPRLPMRYPFTTAYYEALFDGSLGFELLAEFVSYPALGPCQFPNQEMPFDVPAPRYTDARPCQIQFPPAEEAFSVYDHPTVLIFAKTDAYSRGQAETVLPISLLRDVRWMTPLQATRARETKSPNLVMTQRMRAAQESGGTWSRLFNRNALHNRSQLLAVVMWWLFLTALGLVAFPWLYCAFPVLRYRGYGLSRTVGLLTWSYIAWLLSSIRLLPHTRLLLWAVLVLCAALTAWFVYKRWAVFHAFFREHWRDLLRLELLFAVLYLGWTYIRFLNPDLWHPYSGGEKPMDFAYLNAVIKSTWFPPYDPWFAGGTMNYYYFGFVMIGSVIKALGIIPSVGYNLAIPTLFAMTGVGAYTIANNLAGGDLKRGRRAGILGLLLVLILGNLGEVRLLFLGFQEIGNIDFESLIPGYPAAVSAIVGLWEVLMKGKSLPFRAEWWYWNATRVIPFAEGEVGAINEFPAFTFLYADLHAHMMALPLTQVALAIALQWGLGVDPAPVSSQRTWRNYLRRCIPQPLPTMVLAGLIAGALRATNTWDWPTYLGLMSVAAWLTFFNRPETRDLRLEDGNPGASSVWSDDQVEEMPVRAPKPLFPYYKLLTPVLFILLGELLFLPFTANFAAAYSSFSPWQGSRTPLGIYLIMHGQFLFPLVVLAVVRGRTLLRRLWQARDESTLLALGMVVLGVIVLGGALLLMGVPVAWSVIPLGMAAALLVVDPHSTAHARQLWMWVGTALALSLLVEVYVLDGDIGRMNTVFKFYLQVWMLLGLSAAVAAERIIDYALRSYRADKTSSLNRIPYFISDAVSVTLALLLAGAALYPALAIPAKNRDRWAAQAPRTLDGMTYMNDAVQYESDTRLPLEADYRVIRWLQDNVQGSPTIMEGQGAREYLWGGRISVYTGLPAVAAWRWHSVQQRMTMPGGTVEARQMDINRFYNTIDAEFAMTVLEKYDVQYVILAPYERAYMMPEGLAKFDFMTKRGWLAPVYDDEYSTVYRVLGRAGNE
jgi:YYY domain-containing protein